VTAAARLFALAAAALAVAGLAAGPAAAQDGVPPWKAGAQLGIELES
jgi:hypothetical protein